MKGSYTFRANDQTPALLRAAVDGLNDVDHLLLVLEHPVELVVVAGAEVHHHVLVAEEEEDGAGVVQLVHGVEVGDLVDVANVNGGEVAHALLNPVEYFVLAHAVRVPVAAEADHDQALVF